MRFKAVDFFSNEQIQPIGGYPVHYPGTVHPMNCFCQMVCMANAEGAHFEIIEEGDHEDMTDERWDIFHKEYKDVTEKVYKQYVEMFPEYLEIRKVWEEHRRNNKEK